MVKRTANGYPVYEWATHVGHLYPEDTREQPMLISLREGNKCWVSPTDTYDMWTGVCTNPKWPWKLDIRTIRTLPPEHKEQRQPIEALETMGYEAHQTVGITALSRPQVKITDPDVVGALEKILNIYED